MRHFLLLAMGLLLIGCTALRPIEYVRATGKKQYGYSDSLFAESKFNVTFKGNKPTSVERVTDFALLRSTEVALANKCQFFELHSLIIIDNEQPTVKTPEPTTHEDQLSGKALIPTGAASAPTAFATVACTADSLSYNAEFLQKSISRKYGIVLP